MALRVSAIQTFDELEEYLREFINRHGDPAPYDFIGAFTLLTAMLDNLARFSTDADYAGLYDSGFELSEEHRRVLERLLAGPP